MIICCSWCFAPICFDKNPIEIQFTFCCEECAAAFFADQDVEDAGEDEQ